jgi:hypothetical protein
MGTGGVSRQLSPPGKVREIQLPIVPGWEEAMYRRYICEHLKAGQSGSNGWEGTDCRSEMLFLGSHRRFEGVRLQKRLARSTGEAGDAGYAVCGLCG